MSAIKHHVLLTRAIRTAEAGAQAAMKHYRKSINFKSKDDTPINIASIADRESEAVMRQTITGYYPDHSLIGEEDKPVLTNSDYLWSFDALDGTNSWPTELPWFCSSVAVLYKYQPIAAAILVPFPGHSGHPSIYTAIKSNGAQCNGQSIHVNQTNNLQNALVGYNYSPPKQAAGLQKQLDTWEKIRLYTTLPSLAYKLCLLAKGTMDAVWHLNCEHWVLSAAALIVAEAGGKVTNHSGHPIRWDSWQPGEQIEYVATNGLLHDAIIDIL